jgi:hypothetical protein
VDCEDEAERGSPIINGSPDLKGLTNLSPQELEPVRAVRAIGTNALPYLIKWTLDSPTWRRKIAGAYWKLRDRLRSQAVARWDDGHFTNFTTNNGCRTMQCWRCMRIRKRICGLGRATV